MADMLTIEHYVGECFVKCSNIILSSRIFKQARSVQDKRASRWFLLTVEEVEGVTKEVEAWRRDTSLPLIIEIYLDMAGGRGLRGGQGPGLPGGERLLERWTLQYQRTGPIGSGPAGPYGGTSSMGRPRSTTDEAAVYKRLILLVRSLYSYVRILPAYRIFRASRRQGGGAQSLGYKVVSRAGEQVSGSGRGAPVEASFGMANVQQFQFAPVETPSGFFRVAVQYQPSTMVQVLEQASAPSTVPRIIPNYIVKSGETPWQSAPSRPLMPPGTSASVYEARGPLPDPSSSPPINTGAGILRGVHPARHSWSSKVMVPLVIQGGFNTPGALRRTRTASVTSPSAGQSLGPDSSQSLPAPGVSSTSSSALPLQTSTQEDRQGNAGPRGSVEGSGGPSLQAPHPSSGPSQMATPFALAAQAMFEPSVSLKGQGSTGASPQPSCNPQHAVLAGPSCPNTRGPLGDSIRGVTGLPVRGVSTPMAIPGGGRFRARSVTDLQEMEVTSGGIKAGAHGDIVVGADALAADARSPGGTLIRELTSREETRLARQHSTKYHKIVPSSAPAAPRGMLGVLLNMSTGGTEGSSAERTVMDMAAAGDTSRVHSLELANVSNDSSCLGECDRLTSGLPVEVDDIPVVDVGTGSPQLPFAFTPSARSLTSFVKEYGGGGQGGCKISGRDITPLAIITRPSWSSRSSSFDVNVAGLPPSFSVSPMHDLLDSSLLATSTPRQTPHPPGLPPTYPHRQGHQAIRPPGHSWGSSPGAPLTTPAGQGQGFQIPSPPLTLGPPQESSDPTVPLLVEIESESDLLPFALDDAEGLQAPAAATTAPMCVGAPGDPQAPHGLGGLLEAASMTGPLVCQEHPLGPAAEGAKGSKYHVGGRVTKHHPLEAAALHQEGCSGTPPGDVPFEMSPTPAVEVQLVDTSSPGLLGGQEVPNPDVAVGAFIRMLQEAPILPPTMDPLTVGSALKDISASVEKLNLMLQSQ